MVFSDWKSLSAAESDTTPCGVRRSAMTPPSRKRRRTFIDTSASGDGDAGRVALRRRSTRFGWTRMRVTRPQEFSDEGAPESRPNSRIEARAIEWEAISRRGRGKSK